MEIEKEIKQTNPFRNEYQRVVVNLMFSSNWVLEKIKQILEREDITPQQYNILRILRGSSTPLSTLQIRERMIDKMSDTSRIVERLIKKELAQKKISLHDKRLVDVTLTPKGTQLLEAMENITTELDGIVSNLSNDEAQTLNKLLDKIRTAS